MKKSHKVSLDVKEQILNRIKNEGLSVNKVAEEHGLNTRTIYNWLSKGVAGQPSLIEYSKLKRDIG
jgi:transposase-like protein